MLKKYSLMKYWWALAALLMMQTSWAQRIVVLSPDVGEIVVALGAAEQVVGKEQFDDNPALKNVPAVVMHRSVTAESVLSVKPDIVLGSWMAQPASVFERLQNIGVKAVNVSPEDSKEAYLNAILNIGKLLKKTDQAHEIAQQWSQDMMAKPTTQKRYILSYDGRVVAGRGTAGDELIRLAGGINAADVDGLKPLSREGWLAAKPDIIIIAVHNDTLVGGQKGFAQRPEVSGSPAAKNQKIIFLPANDYLRYGLKTPQVLKQLHDLAK